MIVRRNLRRTISLPRISAFFGIVITMYFDDHPPPHFHAHCGEHEAVLAIETLQLVRGNLPPRPLSLVREWAALHRAELVVDWELARDGRPLKPIAPLA